MAAALHENPIVSPTGDSKVAAAHSGGDPAIVMAANWIYGLLQIRGVGSPEGEQVYYFHGAESPASGEADTPSYSWVISLLVGG